jgi:hypothetical protein
LEQPVYDRKEMIYDLNFFLNKMSITESEFLNYLNQDRIEHTSYPNEMLINKIVTLKNKLF